MFPEASIGGETEIIVTSPDYLSKVSQIVATTDRAIMNSYIIWTLVREYLPYMSTKLTNSIDSFRTELLGLQQPLERWEFCSNLLHKFMGVGVEALLEKTHPIQKKSLETVNEVFARILEVATKKLSKYSTVRDLHRHLKSKLNALKLQVGLPEDVRSDSYLRNFYNKLNVLKANLFQSYKNGVFFLKKIQEKRLVSPQASDYITEKLISNPFEVSYEASTNTIIVPRSVISVRFFENDYPKSIIYSRLGVSMAYAVVSSIMPFENGWSNNLRLLSPYHMVVNQSITSLRYPRVCLKKFLVNSKLMENEELANLTTLSTYKYLAALRVAHQVCYFFIIRDF